MRRKGRLSPSRTCSAAVMTLAVMAALIAATPAATQPTVPPSRSTAPAEAASETAKAEFERLPEPERKAIQDALVWTSDHTGAVTGAFGPRTFQAILAYQRRAKLIADGSLDARERAGLQAAAKRVRDGLGFGLVADAATGVRIGVPERVLSKRSANPNGGGRWQSADDKITLDTRAIPAGETDLAALYERNLAVQTPGRKVTYSVLRPDFFVITGETPTGKFFMRYAAGAAGLRGFSLGYDKALAKEFDRTVIAIANSFEPFPGAVAAAPVAGAPAAMPPSRPANLEPSRPTGPIATGLAVAPRRIVTTAAVETCPTTLRVGRAAARVVRADKAIGLALLEIESDRAVAAVGLRAETAPAGVALVVLAYTQSGSSPALVVTPGETGTDKTFSAPLQPGASGAPAFDRSGALLGLVGPMPTAPRLVAGIVPPTRYPLVPAADLTRFLESAGLTIGLASAKADRTTGDIASASGPSVAAIECER